MKSIIPYKKEISFGSKIAEITSMSLEHEINIEPGSANGNFIISGDYKSHEVSVNREPFLFKLPFSIELTDHIDLNSIQFDIQDFSYDILNDDTIEVDIEFSLEADEMIENEEVEDNQEMEEGRGTLEKVEDPIAEPDVAPYIDSSAINFDSDNFEESLEDEVMDENLEQDNKEENMLDSVIERDVVEEEKTMINVSKEDMHESEETIIQNVNPMDDSYATYHIHIVKEGESVETICTMYHSNLNLLNDYNDMSKITIGDKVIIPKEDE